MAQKSQDDQAVHVYGEYYLTRRIALGGMAELFRARRRVGVEGFEKILAIKRILPHLSSDGDFVSMFIDEAKIAAQLTHENIVQIFDFGKFEETYYLAMEYVWGKSLKAMQAKIEGQIVPVNLALYIIGRASMGLDYAHRKKGTGNETLNIIHRDISPQNILVSYEGEVKLVDFGIAKATFQSSETKSGVFKGKIPYMSPEQVLGTPIDQRSDLFSLGIVMYELLTGQRVFQGASEFEIIEKVKACEIDRPSQQVPSIPDRVDTILSKTLERDPDKRYQTGEELHDDITGYLDRQQAYLGPTDLRSYIQENFEQEIREEEEEIQKESTLVRHHEKQRIREEIKTSPGLGSSTKDSLGQFFPRMKKNLIRAGGVGILSLAVYGMINLSPILLGFHGRMTKSTGDPPVLMGINERNSLLEAKIKEASLLLAQGDLEGAIAMFDEVRSDDPRFVKQYEPAFAKAFLSRGKEKIDHSPDSALEDFRRASEMDPENFEAHFEMARLLTGMKKHRKAILSYQKAIERKPDFPDAHFNLGYLYYRKKAYLLAAEEFESVIELKPPYMKDAYFNLGLSYFKMGEKKKALRVFRKILKFDPKNRQVLDLMKKLGKS
ncbi:MAG: protein kinase [Proteobacteria bacterium]|nr:protein kinase [Pseudomonadota bacterium]